MRTTKIEWTESTWNPTRGCTKISSGCEHCYAERIAKRLQSMGNGKYINGFALALHPEVLNEPYSWRNPRSVFVNSMSDLFHEKIPFDYIQKVFKVMNENRRHTFQILTKRSNVLFEFSKYLNWTKNIWMGVTVESQQFAYRIDELRRTEAFVKFLSLEPLISSVKIASFTEIDWVIVGGESGPGARPMLKEWVIDLKNQCQSHNVPFFFKQWGGVNKKKSGRLLEGRIWDEMPIRKHNQKHFLFQHN
ncbi:phage Gp37/Gp68 family protein [candidate division KSB1 bacterium]|nr:phage Gp37/Gp68 family protein [candidate division KSB1 bacterium]